MPPGQGTGWCWQESGGPAWGPAGPVHAASRLESSPAQWKRARRARLRLRSACCERHATRLLGGPTVCSRENEREKARGVETVLTQQTP